MNRTLVFALALGFSLSACIPDLPFLSQPGENELPADIQATDQALAATLAVETLNALPTPSSEAATDTPVVALTETATATDTLTPDPNATATETTTPDPNASATITVTGTTVTGTPPTATTTATTTRTVTRTPTSSLPTPTETLYARFYGTLPPSIPSGKVRLVNRARVDVYVSLQCNTLAGTSSILEYPVNGSLSVNAPAGKYVYVAWVGGRQFSGNFNLGKGDDITLVFRKDKVTVK